MAGTARDTLGCVLAGGESRRMGGNKALIELAGLPLIAHAARPLRVGTRALAVAGDASAAACLGAAALRDPPTIARGPLAGILAALEWAGGRAAWLALVPCDTPFLPDDLVGRLRDTAERVGAPLVCGRSADGVQPLVSLWRTELAARVGVALEGGRHPAVHELAAELAAGYLPLHESEIQNINTPQDVEAARARLAPRG